MSLGLYTCANSFKTIVALHSTHSSMSISPHSCCIGLPRIGPSRCVSPVTRPAGNTPPKADQKTVGLVCPEGKHYWHRLICCPPDSSALFLQSFFSAAGSPACIGTWGYSFLFESLCFSLHWTSWDSGWPVSPHSQGHYQLEPRPIICFSCSV